MKTVSKDTDWVSTILEDLFSDATMDKPQECETFTVPAVNISENLSSFVVSLAAPGLRKEDFSIAIEKEIMTISSKQEKPEQQSARNINFQRYEYDYNGFTRSFTLPENIEYDDIKAEYNDGILKVSLPKIEEKKALKRMVEIS